MPENEEPPPVPSANAETEAVADEGSDDDYDPSEPGRDLYEVVRVIQKQDPQMRQCYVLGSFKNAQLAGVVKVAFTIAPTGEVSEVSDAGSEMEDQEVVDCVMDVFAKMEFRAGGRSPTEVTYPISFGIQG